MGIFSRIIYLCNVQTEWEFLARQLFMTTWNGNLCRRHTAAQRKFSAFLTIKLQKNALDWCRSRSTRARHERIHAFVVIGAREAKFSDISIARSAKKISPLENRIFGQRIIYAKHEWANSAQIIICLWIPIPNSFFSSGKWTISLGIGIAQGPIRQVDA